MPFLIMFDSGKLTFNNMLGITMKKIKTYFLKAITCAVICSPFTTLNSHAATLQTNGAGQLTGVTGLEVLDQIDNSLIGIFDVTFQDGTCADLFNGCDSEATGSDFTFRNSDTGGDATAALLAGLGSFVETPQLILGCESTIECLITIPHDVNLFNGGSSIAASTVWLRLNPLNDLAISESSVGSRLDDFTSQSNRTWAIFSAANTTPPATTVSAPATLGLMGLGLICTVLLRRRNS